MKGMEIIGLDLSLTSTGLALADGSTQAIRVKSSGMERLDALERRILEALDGLKDPVVIVEGYSFNSKNSHAHALGELGGVVRLAFWRRGIAWIDVPPTNRARFATGKGNANKAAVVSAVSARTGITWSNDDELDAWVLQEMALAKFGCPRFTWPETHLKGLDNIDWSNLGA